MQRKSHAAWLTMPRRFLGFMGRLSLHQRAVSIEKETEEEEWTNSNRGYCPPSESRRSPNSDRNRSISGERVAVGTDFSVADSDEST